MQFYTDVDATTRQIKLSCTSFNPAKYKVTTFKAVSAFTTPTDDFDKAATPSTAYFYSGGCNQGQADSMAGTCPLAEVPGWLAQLAEQACPAQLLHHAAAAAALCVIRDTRCPHAPAMLQAPWAPLRMAR